jgi:hypothetical protein
LKLGEEVIELRRLARCGGDEIAGVEGGLDECATQAA